MRESRVEANKGEYKKLSALNWLYCTGAALIIVTFVFTLWFTGVRVADDGMAPVMYEGDVILFDKLAKHISSPARGDAYAFDDGGACIGRIVGLPGDSIEIVDSSVYIGGCLLDESRYATKGAGNMEELTLEKGEFFIMPDNREMAVISPDDMRIGFERLIGRAAVRVAPLSMACVFVTK